VTRARELFEILGGVQPLPEALQRARVLLGPWWAALMLATYAFSGRTAKFVYVDF
jgi:hypothetical protein